MGQASVGKRRRQVRPRGAAEASAAAGRPGAGWIKLPQIEKMYCLACVCVCIYIFICPDYSS